MLLGVEADTFRTGALVENRSGGTVDVQVQQASSLLHGVRWERSEPIGQPPGYIEHL